MLHVDTLPADEETAFLDLEQNIGDFANEGLTMRFSPFEIRELLEKAGTELYEKTPSGRGYQLREKYKNYNTRDVITIGGKLFTFLRLMFADKQGYLPRLDATVRDFGALLYRYDRLKNYPQKLHAVFLGSHKTEGPVWGLTQSAGLTVSKSTAILVSNCSFAHNNTFVG